MAAFEHQLADKLLALQADLLDGSYRPEGYTHFTIHEPKRRMISAAAFRDRVVHHGLCAVIEPRFERVFIPESFANRIGKGTHRAIQCFQDMSRHYAYVLRADIRQHFASIDHAILIEGLARKIKEQDVMDLIRTILTGGEDALRDEYRMVWFLGDDLLAQCRPRGLPIGNLTSQFWSNCYLHPFDLFVKRELGCKAYLRYVDDFALFSNSKADLWAWKRALCARLAALRLCIHDESAQVMPTSVGSPWLSSCPLVMTSSSNSRKARFASRHLGVSYEAYCQGRLSFAEFDARVRGWLAHAAHGDTWGLREHLLEAFVLRPGDFPGKSGR